MLPGIVVVLLFCFVYVWNDMLIALSVSRQSTQTIMLLVTASMQQLTGTYFGSAAAIASFCHCSDIYHYALYAEVSGTGA